jgi:YVTN family beta-propeller protein
VANTGSNTVSVIAAATNRVAATVAVGSEPVGIAVSPDGTTVYVTNSGSNTVSVIDTATNTVTATIAVGTFPAGAAVSPDGSTLYVTNDGDNTVSVIAAATNRVAATIAVGRLPEAFGQFIEPAPRFAGTPGSSNCHGQSVAALARPG